MKLFANSNFFPASLKLSWIYPILIPACFLFACNGSKKKENGDSATVTSRHAGRVTGEEYNIDTKESVIIYKGSMLLSSKGSHSGYVYVSKGELIMDKGQLKGGTVEVDMNSIADIDHGSDNDLVRHFKSPDFFEVEKFPYTVFTISGVAPDANDRVNVTGNLTIKGITHTVTFPAEVEENAGVTRAVGKLTIDRTRWGVHYNSGKFFFNLADEAIADDIEFDIKIVAQKLY